MTPSGRVLRRVCSISERLDIGPRSSQDLGGRALPGGDRYEEVDRTGFLAKCPRELEGVARNRLARSSPEHCELWAAPIALPSTHDQTLHVRPASS